MFFVDVVVTVFAGVVTVFAVFVGVNVGVLARIQVVSQDR